MAAVGWRDELGLELAQCSSRVVSFPTERMRTARVLRCLCGATVRCPLCPLAFHLQCPGCGKGLRYDTDAHSSAPSFYAMTLLPFPPLESEAGVRVVLRIDGAAQTLAIGHSGRAAHLLLLLEEVDEVLPGFTTGHQASTAAQAKAAVAPATLGQHRRQLVGGSGPLEFALVVVPSARGKAMRAQLGSNSPAALLLLRAPCASVCAQAVECLAGALVARTHVPSVHRREQAVLQGKLLLGAELLWHDRLLFLVRPARREQPPATHRDGAAKGRLVLSAWPGPAKLLVFASEAAADPLEVIALTAETRILDEKPRSYLFKLLTRPEAPAEPAKGAKGAAGWTVSEIACPDLASKQRWLLAIREAVREDAAHHPAHAAADTAVLLQLPLAKPAVPTQLAAGLLRLTLRHGAYAALYAGPRLATADQLAAAFASRFGAELRATLAQVVGGADAPGVHRKLLRGGGAWRAALRVGGCEFVLALRPPAP
ncbi:hypothetical protein T492DRAFT_916673, partial [Pavlovales sp. CCMP2436]